MTRTAGTKKSQTHERIVREAAKAIRRDGYAGTSVGEVMKAAGLTHGGFYAHFPSREAMLAEGLDAAAGESIESLLGSAALKAQSGEGALEAIVASYLSDRHLHATETGCTIAALGSETRRQSPEIRHVATQRIKELVKSIESHGATEPLAALATLAGALLIARIVDDPKLADDVRAQAARSVLSKQTKRR